MQLTHLSLESFRNFARLDIDPTAGTTVLVGRNAQGKTSLLEAIYMLATFTSFHASSDREVINFLASRQSPAVARIKAEFRKGDRIHRLEVRIIQELFGFKGGTRVRKEIILDGLKRKIGEAVGTFNAVLFLPQMMQVISGSPSGRRRYLNLTLSQIIPGYADALSTYSKVLSQRNALLKQIAETGGNPAQLAFWDEQLSITAAQIIYARIQAIQEMEKLAEEIHKDLTRGEEIIRLSYQPAYDPLPAPTGQYTFNLNDTRDRTPFTLESIGNGFQRALAEIRSEEIARGVTTIGPHRDELRFFANQMDLGTYGSRGQIRTALLTLKLAEIAWMQQRTGHAPILLLDEVLAELDQLRRTDLQQRVLAGHQAFLTTTERSMFTPKFLEQVDIWAIEAGMVRENEAGA